MSILNSFALLSCRTFGKGSLLFDRPAGKPRSIDYPREKIHELARKAGLKLTPKQIVVVFEDSISLAAVSKRFVLGSFSSALISEATSPVLVLK